MRSRASVGKWTPQQDVQTVRELVTAALADYPVRIVLFGSHARGDAHRLSDIDVAIDGEVPLPPGILATLRETLDEATILSTVDLVELSPESADLRERVKAEGIVWRA